MYDSQTSFGMCNHRLMPWADLMYSYATHPFRRLALYTYWVLKVLHQVNTESDSSRSAMEDIDTDAADTSSIDCDAGLELVFKGYGG